MKYFGLILILWLLAGCSPQLRNSFKKLSKPEKTWVYFHPFKVKKAYKISKEAERVADSIAKKDLIGSDNNGGHLDAFKHSFWMARLRQGIGKRAALSLGEAHEKGNYRTYKKRGLEDGHVPDKISSDMDRHNNKVGASLGSQYRDLSKNELIERILLALEQGNMRVLNKDEMGNFLDCEDKRIPSDSLRFKWETKKCLVPSDR